MRLPVEPESCGKLMSLGIKKREWCLELDRPDIHVEASQAESIALVQVQRLLVGLLRIDRCAGNVSPEKVLDHVSEQRAADPFALHDRKGCQPRKV